MRISSQHIQQGARSRRLLDMAASSVGNYNDDPVLLDDLSIELNTDGEVQVYGYEDATGTEPTSTSLFPYRPDPGEDALSNLLWANPYMIVDIGMEYYGGGGGGGGWQSGWPTPPAPDHSALSDISGCTAGDDHNGNLATGNYPYIGSRGDYARNQMTSGLGDASGVGSVNASGRELLNGSAASHLDWDNNELEGGAWKVTDTTDITPGTAASGAFQVSGGLSVAYRAQVLDATEADGAAGGALSVAGGVDVAEKVWALGGFKAAEYGTITPTTTDYVDTVLVAGAGTGLSVLAAGGGQVVLAGKSLGLEWTTLGLKGESGFDLMNIEVVDGSGGQRTVRIIGKVIV